MVQGAWRGQEPDPVACRNLGPPSLAGPSMQGEQGVSRQGEAQLLSSVLGGAAGLPGVGKYTKLICPDPLA